VTMETKLSEINRGRPRTIDDFDLHLALHNLQDHSDSPRQREWTTPMWQNYVFLAFLILTLWAVFVVFRYTEFDGNPGPPWNYLLSGGLLVFVGSGIRVLLSGVLHRGRLVLDCEQAELRYYRSVLWPRLHARLPLSDIAALVACKVDVADVDPDSSGWTYKIIAAELRDGRLASIAVDSVASIAPAIRAID